MLFSAVRDVRGLPLSSCRLVVPVSQFFKEDNSGYANAIPFVKTLIIF